MPQSKRKFLTNWKNYVKSATDTGTKHFADDIEANSVYALGLIEFCIPSIDKGERLLFTKLGIGVVFISRGVIPKRKLTDPANSHRCDYQTVELGDSD